MNRLLVKLALKFFIIYFYGVFILNIVSIFYLDRANNAWDNQLEFLATLVLPVFIALFSILNKKAFSLKQVLWSSGLLIIIGPMVFFAHVALSL